MIVKDISEHGKTLKRGAAILVVVLAVLFVGIWLSKSVKSLVNTGPDPDEIFLSAEEIRKDGSEVVFVNDKGVTFNYGQTQSDEQAHSGRFSSKLDTEHSFGMYHEIRDIKPGDRYHTSIWRLPSGDYQSSLVVNLTGNREFYRTVDIPTTIEESGWELLEMTIRIPFDYEEGALKIYPFGSGRGAEYYDDLKITRYRLADSLESFVSIPTMNLEIEEKGVKKFERVRNRAMVRGLLVQSEDDWVKGRLKTDGKEIPVEVRLKGDLVGHFFEGAKWSFRIKVKAPHAWNKMMTFSVQNPEARNYLDEWVYHQFLEKEDVLTTRYDFVHFQLNGKTLGLYAYEEHFEKQLVESRNRREGPILKFDESGVWDVRQRAMDYKLEWGSMESQTKSFPAAHTQPFKEKKTLENPVLATQFDLANTLMEQYHKGTKPTSEVFDTDRMAKYCVLTDIARAYHGIVWHNQRFYYNPVISKLEPIGFDGFTETGAFEWLNRPFLGSLADGKGQTIETNKQLKHLFLDPIFVRKYHWYFEKFTRPGYVENVILDLQAELDERERLIQTEFPKYSYNRESFASHARKIRGAFFPFNDASIKAFTESQEADVKTLSLINYHLLPLEIVGWGKTAMRMSQKLAEPLYMKATHSYPYEVHALDIPTEANYIFFQVPGLDTTFYSRIFSWKMAAPSHPKQDLFAQANLQSTDWYTLSDSGVQFGPGHHVIDRDIIIPEGYKVNISAGTSLDFIKQAKFVSRSPVFIYGTESEPILITSSDSSANGFTVLQAGQGSEIFYASFDHFNTLNEKGWTLTGAVTFYESNVKIRNSSVNHSQCEDALNIVRSNFNIRNFAINYAASDGFDADFCSGIIADSRFFKTVNDGMDFSGSKIKISNCRVDQAGDKGLSVGEDSDVTVDKLIVKQAVTGIASKDLSELRIKILSLSDCKTGIAAYQKKPEFGSAFIKIDSLATDRTTYLYNIEPGSRLVLKGREITGK